jgi:hypothetical protein
MEDSNIKKKSFNSLISKISKDYNIPLAELKKYYGDYDILTKKKMSQCKARKQDGNQCTRKSRPDSCFCGKHITRRKFGCMSNDNIIELSPFCYKNNNYFIDDLNIIYTKFNNKYKIIGFKKKRCFRIYLITLKKIKYLL